MDFKDWRKRPEENTEEEKAPKVSKYRGRRYYDYIDEQIREAQEQGKFENLQGFGKPLNLDDNPYLGDKALGYNLLKSNGYAPAEIELANEIAKELERAGTGLDKVRHQGQTLRARRVPPFPSEKRAFNAAIEKAAAEYEQKLRELNRKILTLNLAAPSAMHRPLLEVEKLVQQFRESCPPFAI
jgi:DnaJ homolog subfamily C member 28